MTSGLEKLRQRAEQTGWAIYSQIQKVISLEITFRPQLYFSLRPRKAAKPGEWYQNQLRWLITSCPGTDQSIKITTLKEHTWRANEYSAETLWRPLLRFPPARERTPLVLSLWEADLCLPLLPLLLPHLLNSKGPHKACNQGSNVQ